MKTLLTAFSISCLWHSVFLFFIQAELPQVESYQNNPKMRFLGEVFQSIRPHLKGLESRKEMFLGDLVFSFKRDSTMRNPVLIPVITPQPVKTIEIPLELQKRPLDKKDIKEYNLLSEGADSDLNGSVELDKYSNPVIVRRKFITGELMQDFKNWFKLKSQTFYSPAKRDILIN